MKKVLLLASLAMFAGLCAGPNFSEARADDYSITINEENNLANWQYDWNTVDIGSGNTSFDTGHLRMENINTGSNNFALYTTHKFNEFRMDMHANLNLLSPSDLDVTDCADYCNLYFTFFIDFEDAKLVENVAQAACPWAMNKGWLSVCFERIQGGSHVQLLINETFDGNGGARYFLSDPKNGKGSCLSTVEFVDNQYHWFTIEVTSKKPTNPSRIRYTEVGTNIKVLVDGVEQINYFVADAYYSNTNNCDEIINFHETPGYFGFWASSGFSGGYNTSNTGVVVDIDQLQVTSYDGIADKDLATPYTRGPKPTFHLTSVDNFSPEAEYEAGDEMEIELAQLFNYDGDEKMTYTAKYKGENIGSIRNGYFVWAPEEAGKYNIVFEAKAAELTASNEVRFNVVEPYSPFVPSENPSTPTEEPSAVEPTEGTGCNGAIATTSGLIASLSFIGLLLLNKKRKAI